MSSKKRNETVWKVKGRNFERLLGCTICVSESEKFEPLIPAGELDLTIPTKLSPINGRKTASVNSTKSINVQISSWQLWFVPKIAGCRYFEIATDLTQMIKTSIAIEYFPFRSRNNIE